MNAFTIRRLDEQFELLRRMKQTIVDGLHDGRLADVSVEDLETLERMSVEPIDTAIRKLEALRATEVAR